jgi:hypothetical protein
VPAPRARGCFPVGTRVYNVPRHSRTQGCSSTRRARYPGTRVQEHVKYSIPGPRWISRLKNAIFAYSGVFLYSGVFRYKESVTGAFLGPSFRVPGTSCLKTQKMNQCSVFTTSCFQSPFWYPGYMGVSGGKGMTEFLFL